jgi:hypothetical protein
MERLDDELRQEEDHVQHERRGKEVEDVGQKESCGGAVINHEKAIVLGQ